MVVAGLRLKTVGQITKLFVCFQRSKIRVLSMSWKVYLSGIFGFLHELFGFLNICGFFHNLFGLLPDFFAWNFQVCFQRPRPRVCKWAGGFISAAVHASRPAHVQPAEQASVEFALNFSLGKYKNRLSPGNSSATRSRSQVLATTWSAQTSSAAGVQIPPVFSKSKKQGPRDPGIQQSAREVRAFANSQPSGEASRDKWGEPVGENFACLIVWTTI